MLFLVFSGAFLAVFYWKSGRKLPTWDGLWQNEEPKTQFVPEKATLPRPDVTFRGFEGLGQLNAELIELVAKVRPSVVSIDTDNRATLRRITALTRRLQARQERPQHLGSGAIVSAEGHVITSHHVIVNAGRIRVILSNGRSLPAEVIASDPRFDMAVLRLQPEDPEERFPALVLADSDLVRVGQLAIAIGNPFGLGETVTVGHISARDRSLSDTSTDLFQSDADINPGNSGGPLLNHRGEIIGINTAIVSNDPKNARFQGIGFSVPSNDVKRSLIQILEKGRPVNGYLGLELAEHNDYTRSVQQFVGEGVYIYDVVPGSPADQAGIKPNDVVVAFDGEGITTPEALLSRIRRATIGEKVPITLSRGGRIIIQQAVVSSRQHVLGQKLGSVRKKSRQFVLEQVGMEVISPLADDRDPAHLNSPGVLITRVVPDRLGALAGLREGELIKAFDGVVPANPSDFYFRLVSALTMREVTLRVYDGRQERSVTLPQVGG